MARGRRSVPVRCPRCLPRFGAVRAPDGRRLGWLPPATYVGYLRTPPYAGWKRPPTTCPDCGSALEEVALAAP